MSEENEPPLMAHDPLADLDEMEADQKAVEEAADTDAVADDAVSPDMLLFDATLTIGDAGDYKEKLQGMLDAGSGGVKLDASGIEMIDGAGLQLLAAFFKEADSRHVNVEWVAVSDLVTDAARDIGLSQNLMLN